MGCYKCEMFGLLDVQHVESWMFRMWDVPYVLCLDLESFGMFAVWGLGCSRCRILMICDNWDVSRLGYGMGC